eukprot:19257_1
MLFMASLECGDLYAKARRRHAFMQCPFPSPPTWDGLRNRVFEVVKAYHEQVLDEAWSQELSLSLTENGRIAFRGAADGNYQIRRNSTSGCWVVVGHETGKVVWFRCLRNACRKCNKSILKGQQMTLEQSHKDHNCNRNYAKHAKCMEADAAEEFIKELGVKHPDVFLKLLALDGASDVRKRILETLSPADRALAEL